MRLGDTIVAHASAPGRSGRAIVRLSGPETPNIASAWGVRAWTRCATTLQAPLSPSHSIPALAVCMVGEHSYTGEDSLEILLPGSPLVVDRVVAALLAHDGVRLASPGEFTARAHLHGRLSVEQAEGVALLIGARSEEERLAADRLLSGNAGARYSALADDLASALALVEAGIDFTDQEDVVAIAPDALLERIRTTLAGVEAILMGAGGEEARSADAVVCLAGAPSAGKSTLFNALLGRPRAVVAEAPGTTRDALKETLMLDDQSAGLSVTLVDLAGLDQALAGRSAADDASQRAATRVLQDADVVVHCDPSGQFPPIPCQDDATVLRVRTKADLPSGDGAVPDALAVCALDGWHVSALRRAIADAALSRTTRAGADRSVLPRHVTALQRASSALRDAKRRVEADASADRLHDDEIIAGLLREALDALGEISGRIEPDDVIGRVFAHFCVGK